MAGKKTVEKIEELMRVGDVEPAEAEIAKILEKKPDDADGLTFRARFEAFKGDFDTAIASLDQAIAKKPKHSMARAYKASIWLEQDKNEEAKALLEATVKDDPECAAAQFNLARVLARASEFKKAEKPLKKAIKLEPRNAYYLYAMARLQSDMEKYEESFETLKASIKLNPYNVEAWLVLVNIQHAAGSHQDAITNLTEALKHNPGYPALRDAMVNAKLVAGDNAGALEEMTAFAQEHPDDPELLVNLGLVYIANEQWEDAEQLFRAALERDSNYARAHLHLGSLLSATDDEEGVKQALLHLSTAIELAPDEWQAYSELGLIHLNDENHKDLDGAQMLFEKAVELSGEEGIEPRFNLALSFAKKGKKKKAKAMVEEVLQDPMCYPQLREMAEGLLKEL